jgi:hypothetical protein
LKQAKPHKNKNKAEANVESSFMMQISPHWIGIYLAYQLWEFMQRNKMKKLGSDRQRKMVDIANEKV